MPLRSTEILIAEHREVAIVLGELESLIDEFLTVEEVPESSREALAEIAEFLSRDLAMHIRKENRGLFPALEKFLSTEAGPLAVMLDEHEEITPPIRELCRVVEDLARFRSTSGPAAARARDQGRLLIDVVRSHVRKEERILFPFAERCLSAEEDQQILKKFAELVAA